MLRVGCLSPHVAAVRAGGVVVDQRAYERQVFVQRKRIVHSHRDLVGCEAVDGDGDRCGGRVAISVDYGVVESLGQRLAGQKIGHGRIRVVERVGVRAISVQRDRAVGTGDRRTWRATSDGRHRSTDRRAVGTDRVVGEGIATHRGRASGDAARVAGGHGHIVNDLNGQITGAGFWRRTGVGYHQGNGVSRFRLRRSAVDDGGLKRVGVAHRRGGRRARRAQLIADTSNAQLTFARVDDG